jgi:lipooligosaccharide transport system permease protein
MNSTFINIFLVWRRYFLLFKFDLKHAITTTFVEPLLLLLSLGFGLASLIGPLNVQGHDLSYRQFVFSALIAQRLLFQSFFQASYGSYFRIHYQKIFHSIATTPITLSEILWGELIWDATLGAFSAFIVLLIGLVIGDFNLPGSILAIPFCFLAALMFSGIGLWITGKAKTIDQVAYPQYLFVVPMFLFCGVFFPIETMPTALQFIAWLMPLTPTISIIRTLVLDLPLQIEAIFLFIFWLFFLVYFSRKAVIKSIVK